MNTHMQEGQAITGRNPILSKGRPFDWRNSAIVALVALLIWFGTAIVELERYRYASMLAHCGLAADQIAHSQQQICLNSAPSLRTSSAWDLIYGLRAK